MSANTGDDNVGCGVVIVAAGGGTLMGSGVYYLCVALEAKHPDAIGYFVGIFTAIILLCVMAWALSKGSK